MLQPQCPMYFISCKWFANMINSDHVPCIQWRKWCLLLHTATITFCPVCGVFMLKPNIFHVALTFNEDLLWSQLLKASSSTCLLSYLVGWLLSNFKLDFSWLFFSNGFVLWGLWTAQLIIVLLIAMDFCKICIFFFFVHYMHKEKTMKPNQTKP